MLTTLFESFNIIGCILLAIGIVATALSNQRHLLLYMVAGMAYWIFVELLQSVIVNMVTLSQWHAYVTAIVVSLIPVSGWAIYRSISATQRKQKAVELAKAKYIEHTPVYKDYQPKYH